MRLGDRGFEVKELQEWLISYGFLKESEYNYGPKTKIAVMAVQRELGYRETGVWDDDLYLLTELAQQESGVILLSSGADMEYKVGDRVVITGDDAFYGGLGGDYGVRVPNSQKNGKQHTVMQVSANRQEYLLKEIYSWVPARFINGDVSVPQQPTDKPAPTQSPTASGIKTTVVDTPTSSTGVGGGTTKSSSTPIPVDAIQCYVKNNLTGTTTKFAISPETVTDNVMANFEDQVPKSRTSPFKAYSNSGPRDVSFTIILYQDYCEEGILHTVRCLQALTVPTKSGGYVQAPNCKVVVGKFINMKAVCTSVSVEWAKPYKDEVYAKAEVTLTFNEVEDVSRYAGDWEGEA